MKLFLLLVVATATQAKPIEIPTGLQSQFDTKTLFQSNPIESRTFNFQPTELPLGGAQFHDLGLSTISPLQLQPQIVQQRNFEPIEVSNLGSLGLNLHNFDSSPRIVPGFETPQIWNGDASIFNSFTPAIGGSFDGDLLKALQGHRSIPESVPAVTKEVFLYEAPEEGQVHQKTKIINLPQGKVNYKVIFIKAPAPAAPAPIEVPAPQPNQEKTLVYVLVKKPELEQEVRVHAPLPTPASKPEVFFIKYKTIEEAHKAIADAQKGIVDGVSVHGKSVAHEHEVLDEIDRKYSVDGVDAGSLIHASTSDEIETGLRHAHITAKTLPDLREVLEVRSNAGQNVPLGLFVNDGYHFGGAIETNRIDYGKSLDLSTTSTSTEAVSADALTSATSAATESSESSTAATESA